MDQDNDGALIAAAFELAASDGWARMSIAAAARAAGVPLSGARQRFPGKSALLRRFGELLDARALAEPPNDGSVRDRLFDLLMSRFDGMKQHRSGVRALLRHLPADPATALALACATKQSMRWMLHAAGQSSSGLTGELRTKGLVAVWLWGMRAFDADESEDLAATMAAVDTALGRAHVAANWLSGRPPAEPPADESAVPEDRQN